MPRISCEFRRLSAMCLSLLCVCCAGRNSDSHQQAIAKDSTKSADSSSQAVSVQSVEELTYEGRQGRYLYTKYCAVCHGVEGKGDGFNAFNLDPRPKDFSDTKYMKALGDSHILQTISGGGRSVNESSLMPPYQWTLKKEEIQYVASYLRTFSTRK